MIHTIVITLGQLGEALIQSTNCIIGPSKQVESIGLAWDEGINTQRGKISLRIRELREQGDVLLLTDIVGSTATNIALESMDSNKVEVVTGVNLPMLIKAVTLPPDTKLAEAVDEVRSLGKKSIYVASEVM